MIRRCGSWIPAPRRIDGIDCFVSRSGYTGEDGFEISVPADHAEALRQRIATDRSRRAADRARRARQPAARGRALPLWPRHRHHDDAGRGRAGMVHPKKPPAMAACVPAASLAPTKFSHSSAQGASRRRVGLRPERRAPVREGAALFGDATSSEQIGSRDLGWFWTEPQCAGCNGLSAVVRTRRRACTVFRRSPWPAPRRCRSQPMPFVANTYKR